MNAERAREQVAKAIRTIGYDGEESKDHFWRQFAGYHSEAFQHADAAIKALNLSWDQAAALMSGEAKPMPRDPNKAMQIAAFGSIMEGGRDGPITSDRIRQEAAVSLYQQMWDARKVDV